MQNKLKIAFVILSFGATMLTLYAANHGAGSHPVVGVDVSSFSPKMLNISSRVSGRPVTTAPLQQDTAGQQRDSLTIETTNN